MDNSASIRAQGPGESSLSVPVHLAFLGPDEEHVALLVESRRFGLFRRKDDLLAEGVAAVFGLAEGEAELLALCFHAERFTPHARKSRYKLMHRASCKWINTFQEHLC